MSNAVPEGWREGAIGDVVSSMEGGVSVNSENRPPNLNEYGILKTSSVVDGYFRPSECKAILPAEIGRAKVNPKQGAILFSRMNTPALVGQSGYVDKDFLRTFLPDRLWQITIRREFNSRWFSYLLRCDSTVRHIADAATGTSGSMKNISKPSLLGIPICIPPLPEQQKIAAILSSVDDVIEKTRAQIDRLKDLKTGMMQELLTKGIGPGGVPHTAFKDSPVGRIPEDWEALPLERVVGAIIDCEHKTAPYVERSEYLVVRTSNVRNGQLVRDDMKFTTKVGFDEWTKRAVPLVGDILFTREAPAGESCMVPKNTKVCMGQRMVLLRPNLTKVHPPFLSLYLTSEHAKLKIYELSIGTTVTRINIEQRR